MKKTVTQYLFSVEEVTWGRDVGISQSTPERTKSPEDWNIKRNEKIKKNSNAFEDTRQRESEGCKKQESEEKNKIERNTKEENYWRKNTLSAGKGCRANHTNGTTSAYSEWKLKVKTEKILSGGRNSRTNLGREWY